MMITGRVNATFQFRNFEMTKHQITATRNSSLFRHFSTDSTASRLEQWKNNILNQPAVEQEDFVNSSQMASMANTLGYKLGELQFKKGTPVPPTWHLAYFHPQQREHELAADGYETDYSPPPPFIQRMWAGSSISFVKENPLLVGQDIKQKTICSNVESKKGSRGDTVFVTLTKDIYNQLGKTVTAHKDEEFSRKVVPTEVMLFRYSALTFNAHRIHYDYKYATQTEGYPGILVHGPLSSCLLVDLFTRNFPDKFVTQFNYRALSPLFVTGNPNKDTFWVCGKTNSQLEKTCSLWVKSSKDNLAMTGTAKFD